MEVCTTVYPDECTSVNVCVCTANELGDNAPDGELNIFDTNGGISAIKDYGFPCCHSTLSDEDANPYLRAIGEAIPVLDAATFCTGLYGSKVQYLERYMKKTTFRSEN